jgi:hypothetical protein
MRIKEFFYQTPDRKAIGLVRIPGAQRTAQCKRVGRFSAEPPGLKD